MSRQQSLSATGTYSCNEYVQCGTEKHGESKAFSYFLDLSSDASINFKINRVQNQPSYTEEVAQILRGKATAVLCTVKMVSPNRLHIL